jgi:hypothetical protein
VAWVGDFKKPLVGGRQDDSKPHVLPTLVQLFDDGLPLRRQLVENHRLEIPAPQHVASIYKKYPDMKANSVFRG